MSTDQPYTPDTPAVRESYVTGQIRDGEGADWDELRPEVEADFNRFIAQVKRAAARKALDRLVEAERDMALTRSAKDDHAGFAQCMHAAQVAEEHRDTHYPEGETP